MSKKTPFVAFPACLTPVVIVRRRNRFAVEAALDGDGSLRAAGESQESRGCVLHLPNSGRMSELLTPDTPGLAWLHSTEGRKTQGTLLAVYYNNRWVSVDARMPNRLLQQCLEEQCLSQFAGYDGWQAEAAWGQGRIDFLLTSGDGSRPPLLLETKSCNLVEDGLALFPDAPTGRGARHLRELMDGVRSGYRAAVVWFVQRDDATRLAPHRQADPAFADAVADARAAGVELYAYRCRVTPEGIYVLDQIPVQE